MNEPRIYPMLVVDAGNTRTKFARVARRGGVPRMFAELPTAKLTARETAKRCRQSECATAAAACVVPAAARALRTAFPDIILLGADTPLNFSTDVDRHTVGADRLANIAEAARRFGKSVVVSDFGTAATFDLLNVRGHFVGGAIAPGVRMLAEALAQGTAQLPLANLAVPRCAAGRNTRDAIASGVAGGYAGLVRHLLRQLHSKHLVFTGGDARLVAKLTGLDVTIDPLWTLRGISLLGDLALRTAFLS